MEDEGSLLEAILDEDGNDFDMMDVEEGELVGLESDLVGLDLRTNPVKNVDLDIGSVNQEADGKKCKRRKKKKKKPRKKERSQGANEINIDRFVLNACKCLKEKKTHMVYAAVGCLGVSALSDIIKEKTELISVTLVANRHSRDIMVDAIQACGGQKIANGNRFRNGGGILWNVLKTRDPNAYKEIMTKTRDFEKQFRQQNKGQVLAQNTEVFSEKMPPELATESVLDCGPDFNNPLNRSNFEEKRAPVRDRIRMPVTYDDLLDDEGQKTQTTWYRVELEWFFCLYF